MKFNKTKTISHIILAFILIVTSISFGLENIEPYSSSKISIGVEYRLNNDKSTEFNDGNSESKGLKTSTISPWVGIRKSSLIELRPSINFNYIILKTTTSDSSNSDSTYKRSQYGLGLEFGVHFYLIERGIFTFSIGPSIPIGFTFPSVTRINGEKVDNNYKYFDMDLGIKVPINFNLIPSKHIGFKVAITLIDINLNFKNEGIDDNNTFTFTQSTSNALTHFLDQFALSIFVYF